MAKTLATRIAAARAKLRDVGNASVHGQCFVLACDMRDGDLLYRGQSVVTVTRATHDPVTGAVEVELSGTWRNTAHVWPATKPVPMCRAAKDHVKIIVEGDEAGRAPAMVYVIPLAGCVEEAQAQANDTGRIVHIYDVMQGRLLQTVRPVPPAPVTPPPAPGALWRAVLRGAAVETESRQLREIGARMRAASVAACGVRGRPAAGGATFKGIVRRAMPRPSGGTWLGVKTRDRAARAAYVAGGIARKAAARDAALAKAGQRELARRMIREAAEFRAEFGMEADDILLRESLARGRDVAARAMRAAGVAR